MPNRKISQLQTATSSLASDDLVIRRGTGNFKIGAHVLTPPINTGSFVTTASVSGEVLTLTTADGTNLPNTIVTASHAISASYAVSASVEVIKEVSSSYADTASLAIDAVSSSYALTSSHAVSASMAQLALEAISSSYAISASHAELSDEAISSSHALTSISSSHATNALSASAAQNAVSASHAISASYAISASHEIRKEITSSYSDTASLALRNILTASIATNKITFTKGDLSTFQLTLDTGSVDSASYAESASHSEFADDAKSASYAETASYFDTTPISQSFASDRVMRSGDTMSGILSMGSNRITNVTDPTEPQDALTKNYYDTTSGSFVRSVNGTNPDTGGNVAIAIASVDTGTSASMLAKSSSGGFVDGDVWIISGQSGSGTGSDASGSNGDSYIYSTASGELLEISPLDQAASDQRYVNRSGDTMQGGLILTGDPSIANEAANKNYVDALSSSADTARTNLSSSASTARDAIAADLDTQSSSFATDRLMRAGDTMTGPLSMSGNDVLLGNGGGMRSDAGAFIGTGAGGATLQVNGGTADAFQFVVRNPTNSSDFLFAVTSSGGGYKTRFYRDMDADGNLLRNLSDPLADQDAVTKNYLDTTTGSYVQTVNGNLPDGSGNVTVSVAATSTGLSSSFPASPDDADVYIISGETATDRTASNGQLFIYSTASSQWYQITSPDQTANDDRYVLQTGDTMTGKLVADQGASSEEGINIEANVGNEAALGFLQKTVAQSFLVQESSSPYALRYTSGDKTSLRNIHVATPTATTHATTKAYVDGAFVELSGDTMTGNLTIGHATPQLILNDTTDVNGAAYIEFRGTGTATGRVGMKSSSDDHIYIEALRNNGDVRLTPIGTGLVRVQGPAFEAMRVVRTAGSGGCVIVTENTSGDEVTFGAAQNGNGFIETATGILQVANTGGTARVALVSTPTADSDAATKGYVDGLLSTTIAGAVWSTTGTSSTIANATKVSFNEGSARQTSTNDNTQVSWSTTNNEFALSEGTWHIVFDYRKDTQTNTSIRFFQMQYKTTAGTGTGGGTLIDAAPTINNTTSGGEKVHMEAFLTVPASTTYYVFFWIASGGNTGGRFQKAICRKIS